MDMKTYLKQAAPDEREALAVEAQTSVAYLYAIGGGHKKPGTGLCQSLVAAEPKLTLHELRPDVWAAPVTLATTENKLAGEVA